MKFLNVNLPSIHLVKVVLAPSSHNKLSCIQDSVLPHGLKFSFVHPLYFVGRPQGAAMKDATGFWVSKRFPLHTAHQLWGTPLPNVSATSDVSISINMCISLYDWLQNFKRLSDNTLGYEKTGDRSCWLGMYTLLRNSDQKRLGVPGKKLVWLCEFSTGTGLKYREWIIA
jgi:hypothetical protein